MWLVGSLAYVLASLSKYLALSSTATSGLWVIGGVIYLLGGLLAVSSLLALKSILSPDILFNALHTTVAAFSFH